MSQIHRCLISELGALAPEGITHFILSASFEERAHSICNAYSKNSGKIHYLCYNRNHEIYLQPYLERMRGVIENHKTINLDSDEPRTSFESLKGMFLEIAKHPNPHVGLDMTGFTREALAMILFLAKEITSSARLTVFYHRASKYAQDCSSGWLSQGVREVRSIMGYPGRMKLSGYTDLILISGFENDRAKEIVDIIQPSRLFLGQLNADAADADNHDDNLSQLTGRLMGLYAATPIERFKFSKSDAFATRDSILEAVKDLKSNLVMASLNSKPAMVGACLAALRNKSIQLVYAQPKCYNTSKYSEPSGNAVFFDVEF